MAARVRDRADLARGAAGDEYRCAVELGDLHRVTGELGLVEHGGELARLCGSEVLVDAHATAEAQLATEMGRGPGEGQTDAAQRPAGGAAPAQALHQGRNGQAGPGDVEERVDVGDAALLTGQITPVCGSGRCRRNGAGD